jgi:hypothetical protein
MSKATLKRISRSQSERQKLPAESGGLHAQEVDQAHTEGWVDHSSDMY